MLPLLVILGIALILFSMGKFYLDKMAPIAIMVWEDFKINNYLKVERPLPILALITSIEFIGSMDMELSTIQKQET